MKVSKEFPEIFHQIDEIFASHGILAEGLSSYALRSGQIDMAKLVAEALLDEKILVVEAGTGTGKTLAYLVPGIIWTSETDSRLVISTNTINLQDQIWNQDIPMLQRLLPYEFSAVRLKGRSNYICLRKWRSGWQLTLGDSMGKEFHDRLEQWVNSTETGDKSELNLSSIEDTVWHKYSADDYSCHGPKCKWAKNCFLRRIRTAASLANIVLVNHSLLLTDAGGSFGILPEYSALVIDEAHNLNAAAVNHFSLSLAQEELLEAYGLSGQVTQLVKPYLNKDPKIAGVIQDYIDNLQKQRSHSFRLLTDIFEKVNSFFYSNCGGKKELRLQSQHHSEIIDNLLAGWRELLKNLSGVKEAMVSLGQLLEELSENDEFKRMCSVVDNAKNKLAALAQYNEEDQVLWLEEDAPQQHSIRTAPLNAGGILSDLLYSRLDCVILTSATLRLQNSFKYFAEELGLSAFEDVLFERVLPAFDFSSQAKIFIADDLPEPHWEKDTIWVEACAEAVAKLTLSCTGNVLALFTSHRHLLKTYQFVKDQLEEKGVKVLAHDIDGDRYNLVQAMKTESKTLLLGTGSFWEGIDVPGDCLQSVIICKLPFPVPDSPLFEAKVEKAREQGKNPFTSIFLPVCTVRLLQGIGRLIRSEEDFGFAVILDGRLITKAYSSFILDSLPDKAVVMDTYAICETMEEMIAIRKTSPPRQTVNKMVGD